MKNTIKTIAAIIVVILTINTSFAKTKTMTANQVQLKYNQVDSSLIGTWEKNKTNNTKTCVYCQFNQNGTYITFEEKAGKYSVTGKGKWMVKDQKITIVSGNEVSSKTAYISTENNLVFSNEVAYSKPSALYANK